MCRYQQDCLETPSAACHWGAISSGLWWGKLVPRAEGCVCVHSVFSFASSQPLLNSPKQSACQVGCYSENLFHTYIWTADYDSQVLVSCKILWSSPGRGVGNGAACLLSPVVVVCVPPTALGAISPSSLHSQTRHLVPNNQTSLNWK